MKLVADRVYLCMHHNRGLRGGPPCSSCIDTHLVGLPSPRRRHRQLHVGPVVLTHPVHLLRHPAPERCLASSPTLPAPVSSSIHTTCRERWDRQLQTLSLCVHLQLQPLVPPHPVAPFFFWYPSSSCCFVLHQSKTVAIRPFATWVSNVSSPMEDVRTANPE